MRFDIHFRSDVCNQIDGVVANLKQWNADDEQIRKEIRSLADYVGTFEHCYKPDRDFLIAGADGSGDFPCVRYGDSFVYVVVALARLYSADKGDSHLVEHDLKIKDVVDFLWLPEAKKKSDPLFDQFFERIGGDTLEHICEESDYNKLSQGTRGVHSSAADIVKDLRKPEAHDAHNIPIQMMGPAETAVLIRALESDFVAVSNRPVYLIQDTTLSLPFLTKPMTLFFEVYKRYACVKARKAGACYFTLSKSHNMPHIDLIEELVGHVTGSQEHWYLRMPNPALGEKPPAFLDDRAIPPKGAVTYLFNLHKNQQPMRIDLDWEYWKSHFWSENKDNLRAAERQFFRDIDFSSHDMRCYGYPYPVKASHDMVSLTAAERAALRKQVIDRGLAAGLKYKNFLDPSFATGHK